MVTAVILTHPPSQAEKNKVLSPHVQVQISGQESGANFFAMAVLLDPRSSAVAGGLLTEPTTGGVSQNDGSTMIFTFSNSSIIAAGTYKMRLDIYSVNDTDGAKLETQLEAGQISVTN
ncbi:hypothetical protein ISF_08952 [Cordyceps fumosorosea ARSEF 2679]|uniref:Velvet factor n=1 Tax=Cordyceps fumosorosea (strain ARSEF 2679) TaxID=1081104 RepID=A0A162MA55_CORFA|nr:hypothetical protein ISF_08952 [Cordyceps fumosorosea ARSEF 2679]OAA53220.1 hypothetical protein ISF_08952 [Cordyceps fumosorosea ARSEF 2679]